MQGVAHHRKPASERQATAREALIAAATLSIAAMHHQRDSDLLLIEEMRAPPPLEDARRSLEYWEQRHRGLPLYRRRARREAIEMARRWETRVRAAQQARFDSSPIGRVLAALGIRLYAWRFTKAGVLSLAWAAVPRPVKLVAGGLAAAWLVVAAGIVAASLILLAQLT
jgi:hypothetical protein